MREMLVHKSMRRLIGTAALIGIWVTAAGSAQALPLNGGDTQWKTHASVSSTPKYDTNVPAWFTAPFLVDSLTAPMAGTISGTVITTIYRNPQTQYLAFDYRFVRNSTGNSGIVRATIDGEWANVSVLNAGANASGTSGTGDANPEWTNGDPLYIARDPLLLTPDVQFRFGNLGTVIGKNNSSSHIFFETNALLYMRSGAAMIDASNNSSLADVLAPQYVVPEPGTLLLSLGSVGLILHKRRNATA